MKVTLFGYGSLMHISSLGRALGRLVTLGELQPAQLKGFRRDWRLVEQVFSERLKREVDAAFLDLRAAPNEWVNGCTIQVSQRELEKVGLREKNYRIIEVTGALLGGESVSQPVVTSVGSPQHRVMGPGSTAVVLQRYLALVQEAVAQFDETFAQHFIQTTDPIDLPVLDGQYSFLSQSQRGLV